MRQIFLDTETTGMPAIDGHRIIEIGCVEMIDRELTGKTYHQYLNPEREVDEGAYNVHGISDEFLIDKPVMKTVVDDFLNFVNGAELIIHNAPFDVGFLDYELSLLGREERIKSVCSVLDTLTLARKKYPGSRASLDALTKRFGITQFNREYHGALLDSEILAQVYIAMTGGQAGLSFSKTQDRQKQDAKTTAAMENLTIHEVPISDEEIIRHQNFFNKKNH